MRTHKLYKRDNTGAVRVWWVEIDGRKYRLHSGQEGGKIITSEWTICEGKNKGRANATDDAEQCAAEVKALYIKKLKRGYDEDRLLIDHVNIIKPMLAHKYEEHSHKLKFPIYSQPKLDGIRCLINAEGMWSRKNEKITTCPHLEHMVKLATRYDVTFDGELYNHEYKDNFNKIASLVRKQKVTPEQAKEVADKVQYHIYDIILEDINHPFSRRWKNVKELSGRFLDEVKMVNTNRVDNQETLDELYGYYVELGYEGQMVRVDTRYHNKRSDALLKRKEFQDEEFKILDILEGKGNRSGMVGTVLLRLEKGRTFNAALMGTDDYRRQVLKQKEKHIGKYATVKYFHKTPDGVPRFPVIKTIIED